MNLKTKLIVILSSVLFIGFSLTHFIHYRASRDALHRNLIEESLPLISNNIYSEIQRDLMRPIYVSSLMAHDTFVMDWLIDGESNLQKIKKYLSEIKERYEFDSVFLISSETLNYYHYNEILKQISPTDAHDVWYYDFLKLNKQYDLVVDTDEAANNRLTIFINHRLSDYQNNLLGVIGVGLSMNQIGSMLAKHQGKYNRNIYLVDSNGVVQVHSDIDQIHKTNVFDLDGIRQYKDAILASQQDSAHFEFNRDGKHILLITRYIPEFNWYLMVEQDETSTMATIRSNLIRNLLLGFLITCLVIIINIFIINHFQSRLEIMATTDPLTGSFNRKMFLEKAQAEFARCRRYNKPLSVLMMDLDRFKNINDTYGHAAGDVVLQKIVFDFFKTIRDTDILGRVGGEEFAVLLVETENTKAQIVSKRICSSISNLNVEYSNHSISTSISIGLTSLQSDDLTFEALLKRADRALYRAKNSGRNRVESI